MFMYVAYTSPHWPLHALAQDIKKYDGVYEAGWDKVRENRLKKQYELGIWNKNIDRSNRDEKIPSWVANKIRPGEFPFKNEIEILEWYIGRKGDYPGSWKDLSQEVYRYWYWNATYKKYEKGMLRFDGEPGFNTVTGMVELCSTLFESWGEDALPYYKEPHYSPYSTPELFKEYPLVLTTGARTFTSFHSEHRQIPSLRAITPDPIMEIHPDTAAALGIKEGDWVYMENMFGKAKEKAHLVTTINPKVVHATHGWWYPEKEAEEPSLYGVWESNINTLIPHKHIGKLGFGAPFKSVICRVYKAEE